MSTLWTPSGEHPVERGRTGSPPSPPASGDAPPPSGGAPPPDPEAAPEDVARLEELRRQLADAPAEVVVANHCFGLFELAGVYLSQTPPRLEQARLAIDAFGAVVEGVGGRLGETEGTLRDALAQIRMAFVQISGAEQAGAQGAPAPGNGAEGGS